MIAHTLLLAFFASIALASVDEADVSVQRHWANYKVSFAKVYSTQEEHDKRFEIFRANNRFIEHFPTNRGFTVGHNEFSDMTHAEFRAQYNGMNITRIPKAQHRFASRLSVNKVNAPSSIDWRTKGAVTAIKNQGQCGSCWSFSATGSMEGAWFLKGNTLTSLSEQNLVDCSTAQGNEGCNGGLMDQAFQYVITNNGIDTEASYPYTATGPNACQYNAANKGSTISSFSDIPSGSETALQSSVGNVGPTSVAIDASQQSFQFYSGGVYNEPACSSTQLDHGVLAIGYGMYQSTTAYWLVKNSWGTSWGLNGYIMMSRDLNNQCGIATAASYPIV